MRYAVVALAALALLFTAAWVSWEDSDGQGTASVPRVRPEANADVELLSTMRQASEMGAVLDADVTRLIAYGDYWRGLPDIRVAGTTQRYEDVDGLGALALSPIPEAGTEEVGSRQDEGSQGEGAVDDNPYLEPATKFYGVEWAREALIIVRFRESSNIVAPCVVGASRERGPFQFMLGTWAGTPYVGQDPCDLEAATWAAAWFVKEGRQLEWTTWPR